jgi:hypothetical protein
VGEQNKRKKDLRTIFFFKKNHYIPLSCQQTLKKLSRQLKTLKKKEKLKTIFFLKKEKNITIDVLHCVGTPWPRERYCVMGNSIALA